MLEGKGLGCCFICKALACYTSLRLRQWARATNESTNTDSEQGKASNATPCNARRPTQGRQPVLVVSNATNLVRSHARYQADTYAMNEARVTVNGGVHGCAFVRRAVDHLEILAGASRKMRQQGPRTRNESLRHLPRFLRDKACPALVCGMSHVLRRVRPHRRRQRLTARCMHTVICRVSTRRGPSRLCVRLCVPTPRPTGLRGVG